MREGLYVGSSGDLETVGAGAVHAERPASDRREGLDESPAARAQRDRFTVACHLGESRVRLVDKGFGKSQWHLRQRREDLYRTGPAFWRRIADWQFEDGLLERRASRRTRRKRRDAYR